jgi:hypothetical protein
LPTATASVCLSVEKSVSTFTSGLKATTATGRSGVREAMKARAASIAPAIGFPVMLSEASIRRMTPLVAPGASTPSPVTGSPFSVTDTWPGFSVVLWGS